MNNRTRFRIFMRDSFTCQYCGKKGPATELHVDHRFPKSKGGKDTDDNFVTACIACNYGKSDTVIPVEYIYHEGPKDGQTVRRGDPLPAEWIWEFGDGSLFSLNDALVDIANGAERRFVFGPHAFERLNDDDDRFRAALAAVGNAAFPDGRRSRVRGAYVSHGTHPDYAPMMNWYPCEQIVLLLLPTVGDLPALPGTRRSILDG